MLNSLNRRDFISAFGIGLSFPSAALLSSESDISRSTENPRFWSADQNRIRFGSTNITNPVKILFVSDTHLYIDDFRGEPFRQYSARMAGAYNETTHFQTGIKTNPEESLRFLPSLIQIEKPDAVVLLGDILSFPSEAGVELLCSILDETGVPWYYISGNHDWHYEGLPGTELELRKEWTAKRLTPLYHGNNPMMYTVNLNGLNIVLIDDSVYEIIPEQLDFLRVQIDSGIPFILGMHIPLYVPGRDVGFGCGHPDWNAANDRNWEIERRPRWRESGHSEVTFAFHYEVFSAPNILGVFTGHIHGSFTDSLNGVPQFVVPTNSNGNYKIAEFKPIGNWK